MSQSETNSEMNVESKEEQLLDGKQGTEESEAEQMQDGKLGAGESEADGEEYNSLKIGPPPKKKKKK